MRAAVDDTDHHVYAGKLVRALDGNAYPVPRHVAADDPADVLL
ncbi:hypothetical protein ACIPYQ_40010 [Streptomyces sp. NPDC090045]